ncbi:MULTISPECIES: peptidoglycan D,D-transpeptidase FtsI family protein [unclassified Arthrobacter]|uniref:peptidoglycan D,D-transpeptidase FtsI family protein n=1 Tax=unclassified Arthrobacter TaxID=235627 RepID=UPI000317CF4F|nr:MULTISPECIES: penicillin-binding protein 2 [unclassified Arthrobacter]PVE19496.1 penicillin-binding protein 2 [Arthrobacter sp. Bz4]
MATATEHDKFRVALGAKRLRVGLAFVLILLLVLGVRLFQVQALDLGGMAQAGLNKRLESFPVQPMRGDILDSKGNYLARSVERFDIVVDQTLAEGDTFARINDEGDREELTMDEGFAELSTILGQDAATLEAAIIGDKKFGYVAQEVTPEVKNAALAVRMPGVYADPVSLRTYPSGPVAGSIVGFVGEQNEGLELTQDDRLTGEAGSRTFEIGGDGIRIPYATNEDVPAKDGQSVKLTIDQDLQWFAQQTIASQVEEYDAQWGNIVVVEADTGGIVAMAESTTMDPNNPGATEPEFRKPLSVTSSFEPGSTTKLITMAAGLEEGIIEPTSEFLLPNTYTVDNQTFKDAFEHGEEQRTAAGIFAKSMNTGTVMIGEQLSKQQRYDWLTKFGIGQPLDVGLNGETSGILAQPEEWDDRQQYTVLFGQGLAQTALHTAMVYQTIANDGVRLKPRLIDAYIDPDGTEHKVPQDEGVEVVSTETSGQLQKMLETVTVDGSGASGALDEYRVGSKTGTAEAPSATGGYDGYTLTYAGMAPMDDPEYVVVVTLQRPQGDLYYLIPGESFQKVMEQVLNARNVAPSTGKPETYPIEY